MKNGRPRAAVFVADDVPARLLLWSDRHGEDDLAVPLLAISATGRGSEEMDREFVVADEARLRQKLELVVDERDATVRRGTRDLP